MSTKNDRPGLVLNRVTLLHPEALIETRLVDQDGFAAAIRSATDAVIAYDASHVDRLPDDIDLVLVARPSGLRWWLVGAKGDLVVPELEELLARLPKVAVREGNVAAVQTLARVGTKVSRSGPYLPSAWKAAAGKDGSDVDQVIDASWPH